MAAASPTRLTALILLLAAAGCASVPPLGEPLKQVADTGGYRFREVAASQRNDDLLLMVTFSGGGNRAAALAYGTLAQLASDQLPASSGNSRMLDAVDVISSVSGGSIVGAYYVLHGDALFTRFRKDYLEHDAQSALLRSMLFSPVTWTRLLSRNYGRGDLLADYLDRRLFGGATFADLASRPDRPFLVINATDLSAAGRFEFTQDWFDVICSDLRSFPVSRAVAASSAYPVLMTPIVLGNHGGTCGYEPSERLLESLLPGQQDRGAQLAERIMAYQDSESLRFLHLADGAMSDNLGVRAAIDALLQSRDVGELRAHLGLEGVHRVAVICLDAAGDPSGRIAASSRSPGMTDTAELASAVLVEENAAENRILLQEFLADLGSTAREGAGIETYWIDVRLDDLADEALRQRLRDIPTNLHVESALSDELICSARELLSGSREYARLLRDMGAGPPSVSTNPAAARCDPP